MNDRLDVHELGAKGDDRADDNDAIQAALDRVAGTGGTVFVPPGRYHVGTLLVRSRTTLELAAGATIVGPGTLDRFILQDYGKGDTTSAWDEAPKRHTLVVRDAEQVTIRGQGTIEGQGKRWCTPGATPASWWRAVDPRPDVMVAVANSRDVVIEDITLTDPPNWNLDLYNSERIQVRGVTIASDPRLPNNDGIDISGSQDVIISDSRIEVGDDGIVINGRRRAVRRVVVTNCLISSECAALKVGWEYTRNDISQIAFSNCVLSGCNRGLAAYSCAGATIEDVVASNLVVDTNAPLAFCRPIHLDLRRGKDGERGAMRRIQVSNMVARTQGRILITGDAGSMVEDVVLRDVTLSYPYIEDPEPDADGNTSSQFSNNNRAARRARAAVVAENVTGLGIDGLRVRWPEGEVPDEWRIAAKRENGGSRIFRPDYSDPRPCAFSALWGRNLQGGWFRGDAEASGPGVRRTDLNDCTIRVEG